MRKIAKLFNVSDYAIRTVMNRIPKEKGVVPVLSWMRGDVTLGPCCPYIVPRKRAAMRQIAEIKYALYRMFTTAVALGEAVAE